MRSIHVATPSHRASDSVIKSLTEWGTSMLKAIGAAGAVSIVPNCPWLDCARADLAAGFMGAGCDLLFFRDDDIYIEPSVLEGLISLDAPIAVAPYRTRHHPHNWSEGGLGCTLIQRRVMEVLYERYPTYDQVGAYDQEGGVRSMMFTHLLVGRKLLKEDQAFYYRAAECGFKPVELIGAEVTHGIVSSKWPEGRAN